jgi:glutamine amidotransferase
MKPPVETYAAIVDYGLGNLRSVQNACVAVGLASRITSDRREILDAAAVILPGVGAFGDAMQALTRLDLVAVLQDVADGERPFVGVCLGLQLLMSESEEFGSHRGLDIIPGRVVRFDDPHDESGARLKIPQVGWNRIHRPAAGDASAKTIDPWSNTLLADLPDGGHMYFVHSYVARPANPDDVLSISNYGNIQFCSGLRRGNITAFQFHPERSGRNGLTIYRALAQRLTRERREGFDG